MKEAIKKINEALSSGNIVKHFSYYLVKDGMICASDGRMVAASPFPCKITFLVAGDEFEKLVNRMPAEPTLTPLDDSIRLTSGRFRGTIQTLDPTTVSYATPEGSWYKWPPGLLARLQLVRSFISDNATQTWALCAWLKDDAAWATNNVALARVSCEGMNAPGILLPNWAIDFLVKRKDEPQAFFMTDNHAAFRWADGSWMRTQLGEGTFPEQAAKLVEGASQPQWEVNDEWRKACYMVADFSESHVTMYCDKIVGGRGRANVEYDIQTPVPEGLEKTIWHPKFLLPVIEAATHWDPLAYPKPATFAGPHITGIIVGKI